ncbi:MAG: hypothetical protein IJY67_03745 [Paludibacteraceae bacterium]|nr:hypothetical protein [Paludibacteraceae bacterium]
MDKLKYIIIVLVIAVLAYFLLKKPSAEEQAEANKDNAEANRVNAEAEAKRAQAKAQTAINDIITNTEISDEEKEKQLALQKKAMEDAARMEEQLKYEQEQKTIKSNYDTALAQYNALTPDQKWEKQDNTLKTQIDTAVTKLYKDMKGGNYHDASIWDNLTANFTHYPAKMFLFGLRYAKQDSNTLLPRMNKQKWHLIKPAYCSKNGKVYNAMKTKVDDFYKAYSDVKDNPSVLNKKAGDVIPGYTGQMPDAYKK